MSDERDLYRDQPAPADVIRDAINRARQALPKRGPWNDWHLISIRPTPDVCDHGRPDHQVTIRQLAEALGFDLPALNATPEQVWNGLLDEVERLRRGSEFTPEESEQT